VTALIGKLAPGRAITRWLTIGALLIGAAVVVGFLYLRFSAATVTVTEAVEGPVVEAFYATGTLQPDREYPIKSNVEGILTEMPVDKGDAVKKNQKIAFVQVNEYVMRFAQAQADLQLAQQRAKDETSPVLAEFDAKLKAAVQQLELAQDELKQLEAMRADNASTPMEIDRARDKVQTQWSAAESIRAQKAARKLELDRDVIVAQKALDIAQWNIDQQTIHSPADGVVLDRPASAGTRMKINDHLMQIANVAPDKLVMRAQVDEEDKTRVRLGQDVNLTLYAYAGKIFKGKVREVYPKADPDRRTFEVDVAMVNPDANFSAGMTGELALVVQSKDRAVIVPSQAVLPGRSASEGSVVWLVRDNRAHRVDVTVGLRSVERTEIVSGVSPGDRVIISPVNALNDGQDVKVKFMDPKAAADLNKPVEETPMRGLTSS